MTATSETVLLDAAKQYYKRAGGGKSPNWRITFELKTPDDLKKELIIPDVGETDEADGGKGGKATDGDLPPPSDIPAATMDEIRSGTRPMVENFIARENAIGAVIDEAADDDVDKIADSIGRMLENVPPDE